MTHLEQAPLGLGEWEGSLWWDGLQSRDATGELPRNMFNNWLGRYESLEACCAAIARRVADGRIPGIHIIVGPPEPQTLEQSLATAKKRGASGVRVRDVNDRLVAEYPVEGECS